MTNHLKMKTPLSRVEQATPEWLTQILKEQRLLNDGEVLRLEFQPNSAFNSRAVHIKAVYSVDVPPEVPNHFLLKCNLKQTWAIQAGINEAIFYQTVTSLPNHSDVIVPCYDAAFELESGDSHILLQDLSTTHVVPQVKSQRLDNLLAEEYLEPVIDTLACFHAFWWQNPQLGSGIAQVGFWLSNETNVSNVTTQRHNAWLDLRDKEGDWLPRYLIDLYGMIMDQLVALWTRHVQPRLADYSHLSLAHNDAYLANFLCPCVVSAGKTYLVDWQSPAVNIAASDLVNLLATFWTRRYRTEREELALKRYLQVLTENGVNGYSWNNLVDDYRYSIIVWLLQPLQDRMDGADKSYWYPKMQCLAEAFEDWRCIDLL